MHSTEDAQVVATIQAERRAEAAEAALARIARDHARRPRRSSARGLANWIEHGARRIVARVAIL